MRATHELKVSPVYYGSLVDRTKTAEVRLNDRCYQVGDICVLRPYNKSLGFLSEGIVREITHILYHQEFEGLAPNYVMLSFGAAP
ncbi:DUF3850 domain-containing protein [Acetobacter lovaniensis]|uniref:DUF3850 domain-containing protein n=1 Tax=Acetobacter lovaniensis TaxID=104100 RepID=A0A841QEW8_9PROT|nr:DUF3850 domain-containing protein [Acetobacter lovaniensis]MBB6456938.1 hypothetical protein [Acetobacter lovaniensis]NHN81069.1 DUF3850 domain-containing protein [Acetobacter lovaniensis]GBQ69754.1 hypothetical protein AA0474_2008 [Acetobacter lovaniensis NRIC 0474]